MMLQIFLILRLLVQPLYADTDITLFIKNEVCFLNANTASVADHEKESSISFRPSLMQAVKMGTDLIAY